MSDHHSTAEWCEDIVHKDRQCLCQMPSIYQALLRKFWDCLTIKLFMVAAALRCHFFPPFDLSASREGSKSVERVKMQEDAMVACVSNSICKFNPLSNSRLR